MSEDHSDAEALLAVIDNGVETDWIDPVESVRETNNAWIVDNGHNLYVVPKKPNRIVTVRPLEHTNTTPQETI